MVLAYVDTGHNKLKVSRNASVRIFEPDVFRTQTLQPLAWWDGGYESRCGMDVYLVRVLYVVK